MSQTCCELKLQFASETWLENLITFSAAGAVGSSPFFPFLDLSDQIPLWYYSPRPSINTVGETFAIFKKKDPVQMPVETV